jgi:hypothetical protein
LSLFTRPLSNFVRGTSVTYSDPTQRVYHRDLQAAGYACRDVAEAKLGFESCLKVQFQETENSVTRSGGHVFPPQ